MKISDITKKISNENPKLNRANIFKIISFKKSFVQKIYANKKIGSGLILLKEPSLFLPK